MVHLEKPISWAFCVGNYYWMRPDNLVSELVILRTKLAHLASVFYYVRKKLIGGIFQLKILFVHIMLSGRY